MSSAASKNLKTAAAKPSTRPPGNVWGTKNNSSPPGLQTSKALTAGGVQLINRDANHKNNSRAYFILARDEMSAAQTPVRVRLTDGSELEGTFWYHDPDSTKIVIRISQCLKVVDKADKDYNEGALLIVEPAMLESFWTLSTVKECRLLGEGAAIGNLGQFATDVDISAKRGGGGNKDRRLQRLDDSWLDAGQGQQNGGRGGKGGGLDGSAGAWDQFAANKERFGVSAEFDENLYTTPKPSLSAEQEAKAARLAREIEGETSRNIHIAEERGHVIQSDMDEEDRFSGVLKTPSTGTTHPANRDGSWRAVASAGNKKKTESNSTSPPPPAAAMVAGKYVPPHLRQTSEGDDATSSSATAAAVEEVPRKERKAAVAVTAAPPESTTTEKEEKTSSTTTTTVPSTPTTTTTSSAPGTPKSSASTAPSLDGAKKKLNATAKVFTPGASFKPSQPVTSSGPMPHTTPGGPPPSTPPAATNPMLPSMRGGPYNPYHTMYEGGGGGASSQEAVGAMPPGSGGGYYPNQGMVANRPGSYMPPPPPPHMTQYMPGPPPPRNPMTHQHMGGPAPGQGGYPSGGHIAYLGAPQSLPGGNPQMMYGPMYGQAPTTMQGRYSPMLAGRGTPGGGGMTRGSPTAPHYIAAGLAPRGGGPYSEEGGSSIGHDDAIHPGTPGGHKHPDHAHQYGMDMGPGRGGGGRSQRTPKNDRGGGRGIKAGPPRGGSFAGGPKPRGGYHASPTHQPQPHSAQQHTSSSSPQESSSELRTGSDSPILPPISPSGTGLEDMPANEASEDAT